MKSTSLVTMALLSPLAFAQPGALIAPRPNGMAPAAPTRHLLINATVHTAPGQSHINTDILIDSGRIVAVGTDLSDTSAIVWDLSDHHVYAGFIEPYFEVNAPRPHAESAGQHWNSFVTPQRDALDVGLSESSANTLREMGFTTALIAPKQGVFRGWSAIVSTAKDYEDDSLGDPPVYQANAAQMLGFDRTGWADASYPTSHMGVIALMRQTLSDAQYRANQAQHNDTSCLDELSNKQTTLFFDTSHELEAMLADKVASEFDHQSIVIVDHGTAHRRLSAFADMGHPVIVPLRFPQTPDVFSVGGADAVDLPTLQHFERAPANARWLLNSGLDVALTTSYRRDGESFWDNLHTAIEKGLPASDALAMMTTHPASILGLEQQGAISEGYLANLVVASNDLFDPSSDAKIIDTWIDGRRHHINDNTNTRFDGTWTIEFLGSDYTMSIDVDGNTINATDPGDGTENDPPYTSKARKVSIDQNQIAFLLDDEDDNTGTYIMTGTLDTTGAIRGSTIAPDQTQSQWVAYQSDPSITISDFTGTWDALLSDKFELSFEIGKEHITIVEHTEKENIKQKADEFNVENGVLTFSFDHAPFGAEGTFTIALSAPIDDGTIAGMGTLPNGNGFTVAAIQSSKQEAPTETLPDLPNTPFGPYAYEQTPEQKTYLIHNATIWTQSDMGILDNGWILIQNGKITQLGTNGYPRIAADKMIDAQGMHISPGLIDAHSHTGLFRFGVNESGQAVTSEVRIADSLDPAHPGFYRQLAGGLTSALLLHGSANPIGGQSQTIKLRWNSANPQDMYFEDAKPGIKFALGENVKQANWGDDKTTRYPQTRMGVETLFRDRFTKAREYANSKDRPRDLELEILAEILAGDRLIHCHSYRQDEILMLCRVAEEFGFKIGTFQHGLETYKVAEIVKEHAIGTSIFSDWWGYKVEVTDAIPFAGPINHEVGLLTSFNSDSDDLARRMHVEAAKAYKYAKLSDIHMTEQDALNFVTLNPAIQLGIDHRVGSLEQGKDADLVIWTGHPLSSLSRPDSTFIDGRLMFSRKLDQQLRARNNAERERLIQSILSEGKPAETHNHSEHAHHHDDHDHLHLNQPDFHNHNQGDCGCSQALPAFHTDY